MVHIDLLGGLADLLQSRGEEEEEEEGGHIPPVVFPIEIDRGNCLVSPAATQHLPQFPPRDFFFFWCRGIIISIRRLAQQEFFFF